MPDGLPREKLWMRASAWLASLGALSALVIACSSKDDPPIGGLTGSAPTGTLDAVVEAKPAKPVRVRLLAFNDFHGSLETTGLNLTLPDPTDPTKTIRVNTGGAAFLAGKLKELRTEQPNSIVISTGDLIGASPLASSLFRDEPTIEVMNLMNVDLNVVGNHEFDRGIGELRRIVSGGCRVDADPDLSSCATGTRYPGAKFAFLAANVVDADGQPLYPATLVKSVGGVEIGFIGVVTRTTPTIVAPAGVQGVRFLDEAETLNRYADELSGRGVQAIVALVHEGGVTDSTYNDRACANARGAIFTIADRLKPSVDVVFSAHTHQGYNCVRNGKVVIQGFAFGRTISQVDVVVDPASGDIDRSKTVARNVPVVNTTNDAAVATKYAPVQPVAAVKDVVERYVALAAPKAARVVGRITGEFTRTPEATSGGDHPAGRLIADAQLQATAPADKGAAQIAFMNPGGVRANFSCAAYPCDYTFGQAFTVQPFGNSLVVMTLSGAQIKGLLEQQATGSNAGFARILQPSEGFSYVWTLGAPDNERVGQMTLNGTPIEPAANYRVAVNSFLAEGGDGFTVLTSGTDRVGGAQDIDALIAYFAKLSSAVAPVTTPRVRKG